MTQDNQETSLWYQATFTTSTLDPEDASSALWDLGAQGVEIRDEQTYFEGAFDRTQGDQATTLIAYFELETSDSPEALQQQLDALSHAQDIHLQQFRLYQDRTWQTAWKDYFHPRHISPRCVVGPPWAEFSAPEGGAKLVIDPGMAFGTGTHETTQVVAQILDELLLDPKNLELDLLDIGTGSGILAFMAQMLGLKGQIYGVDIDQEAIDNALHNLEINGLNPQAIKLDTTPAHKIEPRYGIVLANILSHILIAISKGVRPRVAPGGVLILSGMLEHQVQRVFEAYTRDDAEQWQELERRHIGDWYALVLKRLA